MEKNVMDLVMLAAGIIMGTFSVATIVKIVFDELFKYQSKREAKYEKSLNNLLEACGEGIKVIFHGMEKMFKTEETENKKQEEYDDFDELK